MLVDEQIASYRQNGYLVLPGFKTAAEVATLRERAAQIVEAFDPGDRRTIFSTTDQARGTGDEFLASAEGIHCFFEEEAFDAQGALKQAKSLSINKIGHAMHDLDPVFSRFSRGPRLQALAQDLGLAQPQLWQSMYIFKQPGIGGEVKWHQDASFFDTTPGSVTAFWFALEDATRDNGCLWVQPGGHRTPLRERFVREGNTVRMEQVDAMPWPDQRSAVPVEVERGTLVCFHGLLPHWSAPNRSAVSRHAYTLHATDGRCDYAAANWLQRSPGFPVRGFDE
ncbi:phytanoyl-CoA dioxygenase family protein [Aquabacterium sp.]|uniref:phytanoyl-CoA dioxygenase family protein n=1 Tax=Aquabacterium sp. TaxID=1872578 RepID=UPI002BAE8E52|nr:phytanoyl-CoA dioxygenase family protein [Aquabacterium sp.]HSW04217.1 phytanoyl-CoA dioxygenase family protein [Aquabacterium sp.]